MSAPNTKAISAASRDKFLAVWPGLRDELLGYLDNENMPKDAHDWFKRVSWTLFGVELRCQDSLS